MLRIRHGRPVRWVAALVLCSAVAATSLDAEYRTADVAGLRITFDSDWGARTAPGYWPVRFDITNAGDAREIEIRAIGSRFFRARIASHANALVRQTVRLGAGDRVRFTMPLPVMAENEGYRFEIREHGEVIERFNHTGFQSSVPFANASALIVSDRHGEWGQVAPGLPRQATAGSPSVVMGPAGVPVRGKAPILDFILDPSRVPANWLGFTSLRAVVIGATDWEQLAEEQRSALLTWTAAGGDLLYVDGEPGARIPGTTVAPIAGAARAYFFGRIHAVASASLSSGGLQPALVTAAAAQDSNWALPANRAGDWGVIASRGFRLPIPGVDGVPARAYLMILIVFSLLIGPVNYWFLWRSRQQVMFVLTAPAISAVFIVLLAGYVLAGDGVGVRGRAMTVTMLDQARQQAATRTSASLYAAGLTPSGGLRFPRDVAVWPIGREGGGARDDQTIDLTDAQRFSAGVFEARAPTNIEAASFRTARERVTFSREGGHITVVNGFDVRIAHLVFRDGGRTYTLAAPLDPGGRAQLTEQALDPAAVVPSETPWSPRLVHIFENAPERAYLAVVERSPFWDPGVAHVEERGSFHLVIGWPEGQP